LCTFLVENLVGRKVNFFFLPATKNVYWKSLFPSSGGLMLPNMETDGSNLDTVVPNMGSLVVAGLKMTTTMTYYNNRTSLQVSFCFCRKRDILEANKWH
jgi:hypothetical protein